MHPIACLSAGDAIRPKQMGGAAQASAVLALTLGVDGYAAVPRPSASSLMPLRRPHQAPELRMGLVGVLKANGVRRVAAFPPVQRLRDSRAAGRSGSLQEKAWMP